MQLTDNKISGDMITWIAEIEPATDWDIKKVSGPAASLLDPFALIFSKEKIGEMILSEKNYTKAKKLERVYKSLNEVINRSL